MKNGDKPAYPLNEETQGRIGETYHIPHYGLTKREMFAMAAMQGLISKSNAPKHLETAGQIVGAAVAMADLLLEELEKQQP